MYYPRESRRYRSSGPDLPPPEIPIGWYVRLIDKPERIRKILDAEWHGHRYRYCYRIETSTTDAGEFCPAYWFEEQLEPIDRNYKCLS